MNHAFEDIEVKQNALELLEDALKKKTEAMYDRYRSNDRSIYPIGK